MKKIYTIIFLVVSFQASAEEWITEEVLKQLSEVKQELKLLRKDVNDLQETLKGVAVPLGEKQKGVGSIQLELDDTPYIGEESAVIAVVEFSDYQCPYCKRHYNQTLPSIVENYLDTGKIKYFMKQFPLGFHSAAKGASIAALCVESQSAGSYWRAHENLFSGETQLKHSAYLEMADSFRLNMDIYKGCLDDPSVAGMVERDMRDGEKAGVTGTPAFLVGEIKNGKLMGAQLITGARPYSSFSVVLDALIN